MPRHIQGACSLDTVQRATCWDNVSLWSHAKATGGIPFDLEVEKGLTNRTATDQDMSAGATSPTGTSELCQRRQRH